LDPQRALGLAGPGSGLRLGKRVLEYKLEIKFEFELIPNSNHTHSKIQNNPKKSNSHILP
jgi:hypothetical protein